MEHIRNINYGLWGEELTPEQVIQRIVAGGFPIYDDDATWGHKDVALVMWSIVEGESGGFQRAWHANVAREEDGSIMRFDMVDPVDGATKIYMRVLSVDLGFMQLNTAVPGGPKLVEMTETGVKTFIDAMFNTFPAKADPWQSVEIAYNQYYLQRGFKPWYAYKPGTLEFWNKKRRAALGFANWYLHSFVGRKHRETDKPLNFTWSTK